VLSGAGTVIAYFGLFGVYTFRLVEGVGKWDAYTVFIYKHATARNKKFTKN